MADEPQVIRGIDWRSTFPFTLIFRSFRIAIHPSKLFLALVALILIYVGGRALDGVWLWWPQHRAIPLEIDMFERSRGMDTPVESFDQQRRIRREAIDARHRDELARIGKPNGSLADLEWRIKQDLNARFNEINARYDKVVAAAKDGDARDVAERQRREELRAEYDEHAARLVSARQHQGIGLFQFFFNDEVGQLNSVVNAVRSGRVFGGQSIGGQGVGGPNAQGVGAPLMRFFMWGPLWAFSQHTVFFTIFGLYFLTIWSIFGGAIARIAAVHVARDEKISIRQALAFSLNKFLSFISAPIIPLMIILIVGLVVALGGAIGNIPGLGPILVGALFFLALLAGFIMTLILIGLVGGLNLMYPTIAVEGSDSFDAISRSFSYLYARPWRLAFYTLVAIIYGAVSYIFARFFVYLMLWLSHAFAGLLFRTRAENGAPLFTTMWPEPYANGRLMYDLEYLALTPMQSVGATLLAFWVYLTISMLGAFAISFYFSSNTIIYYLMRNEVDATEMDDVYLEQSDEEFTDTAMTSTAESAKTPTTPTATPTDTAVTTEPAPMDTPAERIIETPPPQEQPPAP